MRLGLCAAAVAAAFLAVPAFAADAAHGQQLYIACLACHGDETHAPSLGPSLKGVVGRPAGSLEDFRYSPAMKRAGFVWDDANLHDYILNPQAKVKGNRMPYGGIANAGDADDVIAYLKTLK
jgi:cytochrome c